MDATVDARHEQAELSGAIAEHAGGVRGEGVGVTTPAAQCAAWKAHRFVSDDQLGLARALVVPTCRFRGEGVNGLGAGAFDSAGSATARPCRKEGARRTTCSL
jgi:hypothetical protein